jgi:hypothetical protein
VLSFTKPGASDKAGRDTCGVSPPHQRLQTADHQRRDVLITLANQARGVE